MYRTHQDVLHLYDNNLMHANQAEYDQIYNKKKQIDD